MAAKALLRGVGGTAALVLAAVPAGAAAAQSYGDGLVARALHRFPALTGIAIQATGRDGTPISIATVPVERATVVQLTDAMGRPIGTARVATRPLARPASLAVAAYLRRRIYLADTLREPDPIVAGAEAAPVAQTLVERMIDRFPDLVTLAMHVAPPGRPNAIVASSFGRIGKPADDDDRRVERDGAVLREVTDGGARLAIELPLLDRRGRTLGALSTSFRVAAGHDPQSLYPRAILLRNALARSIPSRDALFAGPPAHS